MTTITEKRAGWTVWTALLLATLVFLLASAAGCLPCGDGNCYTSADELPGQDLATDIVWKQVYEEWNREPPKVIWVLKGDCNEGRGIYNGECVGGIAYIHQNVTFVMVHAQSWKYFIHELTHFHVHYRTGDSDANHLHKIWSTEFPAACNTLRDAGYFVPKCD